MIEESTKERDVCGICAKLSVQCGRGRDFFYVHPRARCFHWSFLVTTGYCWLLLKVLYGIRMASQIWRETFRTVRSQNDSECVLLACGTASMESFTIGARSVCH